MLLTGASCGAVIEQCDEVLVTGGRGDCEASFRYFSRNNPGVCLLVLLGPKGSGLQMALYTRVCDELTPAQAINERNEMGLFSAVRGFICPQPLLHSGTVSDVRAKSLG